MALELMVIVLGAVSGLCEVIGERANYLLTPDDFDAIEFEGI